MVVILMTLAITVLFTQTTAVGANAILPNGFVLERLKTFDETPMDLEWTPEEWPKLLVTEKTGKLWVLSNVQDENATEDSISSSLAADLEDIMCLDGERGLAGVVAHPNYNTNRFLYLFYTWDWFGECQEDEINGPVNRLSRFVMGQDDVLDMSSEQVLFVTPPMVTNWHNGGDIFFGNDGLLYVSVGDGFYDNYAGPRDPNLKWPRDPGNLLGKMLRLTDDGGIPDDNPYAGPGHVRCNETGSVPPETPIGVKCKEVFASGLRHPFKVALDPNTKGTDVRYFINDVGFETWEEINEGGTNFAGVDYGWPDREGPCPKDQFERCDMPGGLVDPVHWYRQYDSAAILAGVFVPRGVWPMKFDGSYLYADIGSQFLQRIAYGGKDSGCRLCSTPVSDYVHNLFAVLRPSTIILTMKFGPFGKGKSGKQSLYYVQQSFAQGHELGRIVYKGSANRSPRCHLVATAAKFGLFVSFDSSGSTDADSDVLTYDWDFNGNGTVDQSTQSTAITHEYQEPGTYNASLTVLDGNGGSEECVTYIHVG